ncbi:MAG: prolyl oligopeptidase family serine peptidase [Bacteroidales bacterium]
MSKHLLRAAGFLLMALAACQPSGRKDRKAEVFGPHSITAGSDIMTPEILWSFGRISDVQVSPDGKHILYGVSYYDIPSNSSNRELYIMDTDGGNKRRLTSTPEGEYNARWRPDGRKIGYISHASGSGQLWEMNPDGSGPVMITDVEGGITGFAYSPDQTHILFTRQVKLDETTRDIHPDLPLASGRIIDDLMYRHWDHWIDDYSHIFVAAYQNGEITDPVDIMEGEKWDSPVRPFGGMEQISWSPDGKTIAYTSKKLTGRDYTLSTNADIYIYDLDKGTTRNLTEGMNGYDAAPVFSPDGKYLAWESMERDGYESDLVRLFLADLETGEKKFLTEGFEQNVHGLTFTPGGSEIYFISNHRGTDEIYRIHAPAGNLTRITEGMHNYTSVTPTEDFLVATRQSMSKPGEIYRVDPVTGEAAEISFENRHILDQLTMGRVESRWITTTDNKQMLVWVIYPPHFDESKTYPALLYCQGGPQSTVSQFWSYRWNFQMMAANGYIVVAPNRRGVPGFGIEWNEQISGDYGGQNMQDLLQAIDVVAEEPWVDENRLGAVGASYGGYSVYWLAGNHEKRFKAFIAHDGMFNFESQYLETEEMWFPNWDFGGPFWKENDPVVKRSYAASPHRFVENWDTPILVIHGERDYRVTIAQGISAFNAARLKDIPARFLYFPDENHWVMTPQNGILWQRTFFDWLDRWLKDEG